MLTGVKVFRMLRLKRLDSSPPPIEANRKSYNPLYYAFHTRERSRASSEPTVSAVPDLTSACLRPTLLPQAAFHARISAPDHDNRPPPSYPTSDLA
ncbi:hypothetical protein KFK09_017035 [Dendrobium nobile]|uniref:Uncharacterized protein n=1 Tax=Dendrobium nobile TaxID=94219 RepID=A0A8T3B0C6_DENNO|nr:hypothetical protein KFK09_017035 [Dendrobium nobile]